MKATKFSLKRPVTTLMIFVSLILIGVIGANLLPLEFFPSIEFPYIQVIIPYNNATPEEVERQITHPVEEVLATLGGIKRMISSSSSNQSVIFIQFNWGTDAHLKGIEIREKIDSIRNQLPADIRRYQVMRASADDIPVMQVRISSNLDLSGRYDLLDRMIKRRIERIPGVSRVNLYGVEKKEIRIQLLAERIQAHRIDLGRLSMILQNSAFLSSAGKITDGSQRLSVRPIGDLKDAEAVQNLVVGPGNLKLKDIALIEYTTPVLEYGRHLNTKYAIGLDVSKEAGANIVEIGDRVSREIEEIGRDPKMQGINLFVMFSSAEGVKSSLSALLNAGMLGCLLAVIVLFVFMRQWMTTLIVAMAVPVSLVVTLAFMYFMGLSLNILSLLGLMLAVGMLVDNAVVVTENVYRHRIDDPNPYRSTLRGVKEVALAITAGTLTTAIVFLPNIFGIESEVTVQMKHVSISFCIALGVSLLLAQTVVPLLALRIKTNGSVKKSIFNQGLIQRYQKLLEWMLTRRKATNLIILGTLVSIAIPIALVKQDMFRENENRQLRLFYNINDSYTLQKVEDTVTAVETLLMEKKEALDIDSVYTYYTPDYAETTLNLTKGSAINLPQEEIKAEVEKMLPKISIGQLTFDRRGGIGGQEPLRVEINGPSTEKLIELSGEVMAQLKRLDKLSSVRSEVQSGNKEYRVVIDRIKAKQLGFTPEEVARNLAVGIRGMQLRPIQGAEHEINLFVEFQKKDRRNLSNLREFQLFKEGQEPVSLSALAQFIPGSGPSNIDRFDRVTALNLQVDPKKDVTRDQARDAIKEILDRYRFPAGYSWSFGRSFNFADEAAQTMLINTFLALALIYFVMAALFESLIMPAAIWTSIIFSIVGVWWFFLITGTIFDFMAWIGILILIGVVVNNGIVLIDYTNQLRQRGVPRHEALIKAGGDRLRPILMTASTTVFSLVPLCLTSASIGGDGPPYYPMARAIVGGLIFSTLVTLVFLPSVYVMLDNMRIRAKGLYKKWFFFLNRDDLNREIQQP